VTTADADGRFRFTGLPAGRYILRTTVTWETGAVYAGVQGGVVGAVVAVKDGTAEDVIMSTVAGPSSESIASGRPQVARLTTVTDLGGRAYRVLKRVSGLSCNLNGAGSSSQEEAQARLAGAGGAAAADAVVNIVCKKRGVSFSPNCWSSWECEGDAIAFN
jgi:hypothetical protein